MLDTDPTQGGQLPLPIPTDQDVLQAILALARDIYRDLSEDDVIERFLKVLGELFPGRIIGVRAFDLRTNRMARVFCNGGTFRQGATQGRAMLKRSSVEKTRLKTALTESARLAVGERWESPFVDVARGFAIPLVASGELYGVLDIGYPHGLSVTEETTEREVHDEELVLPVANYLSVALRNERLHRETTNLRDYQANLIEYANALIIGIDRKWRISVCNQQFCKLLGYEKRELLGADLRDVLPPEVQAPYLQRIGEAFGSGNPSELSRSTFDAVLVTKAGERIRAVWSLAAVMGGKATDAVVAIGQDQTQIRKLQKQVIQSEKLATLGQLAAGVAHELNNPLTSISVYAEYLLTNAKKKVAKEAESEDTASDEIVKLQHIYDGAQRIRRFAKELVQYAKPSKEKMMPLDLCEVVRRSLSFCEHLFSGDEDGVALAADSCSHVPAVFAVEAQMEQVIINVVTNAVHACGDKGTVTVSVKETNSCAEIKVKDTGTGIAEEHLDKVFEPFFTTKIGGAGTGLGLSIVKNILDEHGGTIVIENAQPSGAVVTISIPVPKTGAPD